MTKAELHALWLRQIDLMLDEAREEADQIAFAKTPARLQEAHVALLSSLAVVESYVDLLTGRVRL